VLLRGEELRHAMYFVVTEWPGGIYASPTMSGSKPGGLIACAWSSLVALGQDGMKRHCPSN
jgi:glutamate/tyrosine decarboxylase-like PLP-dependent enzyme